MIRDVVGIIGLAALATGLTVRFGWDMACIICGVVLIAVSILGAIKHDS